MGVSKLKSNKIMKVETYDPKNKIDFKNLEQGAMYYFKESLKHEENPAAHDGLGCCHHANSDYEEAIAEF